MVKGWEPLGNTSAQPEEEVDTYGDHDGNTDGSEEGDDNDGEEVDQD